MNVWKSDKTLTLVCCFFFALKLKPAEIANFFLFLQKHLAFLTLYYL